MHGTSTRERHRRRRIDFSTRADEIVLSHTGAGAIGAGAAGLAGLACAEGEDDCVARLQRLRRNIVADVLDDADAFVAEDGGVLSNWHSAGLDYEVLQVGSRSATEIMLTRSTERNNKGLGRLTVWQIPVYFISTRTSSGRAPSRITS